MEDLHKSTYGVEHDVDDYLDAEELEEESASGAGWEEKSEELQVDGDFDEGDYEGGDYLGYVAVL